MAHLAGEGKRISLTVANADRSRPRRYLAGDASGLFASREKTGVAVHFRSIDEQTRNRDLDAFGTITRDPAAIYFRVTMTYDYTLQEADGEPYGYRLTEATLYQVPDPSRRSPVMLRPDEISRYTDPFTLMYAILHGEEPYQDNPAPHAQATPAAG